MGRHKGILFFSKDDGFTVVRSRSGGKSKFKEKMKTIYKATGKRPRGRPKFRK